MSEPKRIQLSRAKGWRMPPNTVKVDRSTKWGNPFPVYDELARDQVIERFRYHLTRHPTIWMARMANVTAGIKGGITAFAWMREHIEELRGKNLACWCKPGEPCHADVLLELANPPFAAHPHRSTPRCENAPSAKLPSAADGATPPASSEGGGA